MTVTAFPDTQQTLADFIAEHAIPYDPATDTYRRPPFAAREKMSAHKSLADGAHLRTGRRFLEGKLDRLPNDWELAEWLRLCYHRETYAEAVQLFQHIHPEHVEPERYAELKKIVTVCRMKAGK